MQSSNQYKNLFVEFYDKRFGNGCLSANSLGSRVTKNINQVEEINYQCNSLVQDILSEARSQAQSSETAVEQSIPQIGLIFVI